MLSPHNQPDVLTLNYEFKKNKLFYNCFMECFVYSFWEDIKTKGSTILDLRSSGHDKKCYFFY